MLLMLKIRGKQMSDCVLPKEKDDTILINCTYKGSN